MKASRSLLTAAPIEDQYAQYLEVIKICSLKPQSFSCRSYRNNFMIKVAEEDMGTTEGEEEEQHMDLSMLE